MLFVFIYNIFWHICFGGLLEPCFNFCSSEQEEGLLTAIDSLVPHFCESRESPALRNLNHHVSADAAWPLQILRLARLFSMFGLLFIIGLFGVFF